MGKDINIGDVGIFSGRNDKKVKITRINEKTVTFLIIDENKTKYIYTEDFKKKFTPDNELKTVLKQNPKTKEFYKEVELSKDDNIKVKKINDLIEREKKEKLSKPAYTLVGVYKSKDGTFYEETENLDTKNLLGYRIRYNKEPNMFFGQVNWSLDELEQAKKRTENSNENAEKNKEFKKIREAENKIKREENKIIQKQKLDEANQKFLRKNSQYLQSADFYGIYQYTYPELEDDFKNKTIKGWRFSRTFYDSNPLKEFKGSHYPSDEIVKMNKSFVNKLKNFFTDDEIYSRMSKDEYKSNKRAVKRAIDNDTYKNLLESEELTESELQKIADSVDVSIPKKVFSVENVKAKEMQEKFAKLLSNLPTINKDQLNKLIQSIKIDFKPLEEELFVEEKAKYIRKFDKLIEKEKVYISNLDMTIKIWQDLFSYDKLGYDKIKTGRYKRNYSTKQEEEIIDEKQFAVGLKLKSDWETLFDKFLKNYIDTLKYSFINAIINNFTRITKPITEIVKLRIELGDKGFEGEYRFKFEDGSYFDFKAEAIRAGGYNIQILHLRYITNFLNITLADGSKVTGYSNLIENFNVNTMEKGGRLGQNIKCVNCGWHWNTNQSEEYDKYVCHKCGFDNTTFYSSEIMKHGGLTSHDIQSKTDKYKDMLKTPSNLLKISQMHKVPVEFLQSQLIKGMEVESEHTNREGVAKIIALHHLEEDPRYYIKLEKIENKMADGGELNWGKDFYDEQEWKKSDERYELERLSELVYRAKRDIVDADDTDEAIQKFYDARNEYRAFEQAIKDREDNKRRDRNIESLIEDEIEDEKKHGDRYEYKELFKKSPALAALQSLKDLREWVQSDDSKDYDRKAGYSEEEIEKSVNRMSNYYSQGIKDLEYYIALKKSKSKKLAEGGELNPDDKAVKSAMTHKAGSAGGLLVGKRHSEGGIKAINKSTNSPIEMEGGEVVITRNAVSDNSKREFEGKMMTNRQILSRINESGGGVSFASGGDVPSSCKCSGKSYKYGGKSVSDYDIIKSMNSNIED